MIYIYFVATFKDLNLNKSEYKKYQTKRTNNNLNY